MTCPICNGSGEKDHATLSGYMTLDCTAEGCTAATERAALEAANKAAEPMTVYDQRWFAYEMGRAISAADAARYHWLKERFTGYDFYFMGDPYAETEEGKGKIVIVFEVGPEFGAGRNFESAIDAAIAGVKL